MRSPTSRQVRFIEEYLQTLNATKAAVRAGYSPRTARQAGAQNLSKPVIADKIAEQLKLLSERNNMSLDEFIVDLQERVNADIADIYDGQGNLLPPALWPEVWRRGLVTSVRVREEYVGGQLRRKVSIQFADRTALKYLLGKYLGAFK